jgi:hypothetical protein
MLRLSHRLVAGAVLTGEIECISPAFEPADATAGELLDGAITELRKANARLVVAEFPDSSDYQRFGALLASRDFENETLVPDYFADGIGMKVVKLRFT